MAQSTLPIKEHLEDFAFENAYLNQEENSARYYLDGKGVCVTAGGTMLWYEMPVSDKAFFTFDEFVLNEHLNSGFTDEEQRALSFICDLDVQAKEYLLHVVTTLNYGDDKQYIVFYSPASEDFFQVSMDDIANVNLVTANLMAQYTESNSLAEPYEIHVLENGTIA